MQKPSIQGSKVSEARAFAVSAHGEQRYGQHPYVVHLDAVAALVGDDETAQVVAYLHDVVEDTPVTLQDIEVRFGAFVADYVALLTDEPGRSRRQRKAASQAKLAKVQPEHHTALLVKAADRLANLEACVRMGKQGLLEMYRSEHAEFKAAVYRPGLCDLLWERMESIVSSSGA